MTYRDIVNDDNRSYWRGFKLWENLFVGQKTCTAYIWDIHQELLHNKETPINRDHAAKALAKRNILRQTKTIQISTNLKFISLEFDTTTTMETFCQEPLAIIDACQISFRPDFNKRKRRIPKNYTIISFFNVPAEIDVKLLTDFVDQYANIEGEPRYSTKAYKDIECKTGTTTYKVTKTIQDIPRYNNLFGRSVKCFYNGQPKPTNENEGIDEYIDQNEPNEIDTQVLNQPTQTENSTNNLQTENNTGPSENSNTHTNIETNQDKKQQGKINTNINTHSTNTTKENTKKTKKENKGHNEKIQTQNITTRKKQNNKNNQEYTMHKERPKLNDENFPEIQNKPKQTSTTHQTLSNSYNITIIPETPIEKLHQQQNEEPIDFLSPSLVLKTTLTNSAPQPIDISTPNKQTT